MKLLLVDDHQMVRLGLKSYFELQDDVEVVWKAGILMLKQEIY